MTGAARQALERIERVLDLGRFPIHEPGSAACRALVARCRGELAGDGCCVVEGFLRPESVAGLAAEAAALAPRAHRTRTRHNPYFTADDPAFAPGHPRRCFQDRSNGFVCADVIGEDSDLRALFGFQPMTEFVRRAFDRVRLYRYADPLAALPINTMRPGDAFPWHFDTNEFTVTIVLQTAEEGGVFEYAPNIRAPGDERYGDVAAVLAGGDPRVRRLRLAEGDIQLFRGRHTLHRVTSVGGGRARHVAIPSWAARPGMVGQPHRTLEIYGRLTDAHGAADLARDDRLAD